MIIYPAMDLINGACVRLQKGDFATKTIYEDNPKKQALAFSQAGAKWLHIVDLDGAKDSKPQQTALIAAIARSSGLRVQAGGGIRSLDDAKNLLKTGVERVVLGSLAVKSPEIIDQLIQGAGADTITVALDVNVIDTVAYVATHGWQKTSGLTLLDAMETFSNIGVKHILMTDISRDGLLVGPNTELTTTLQAQFPQMEIQASGGVSSLADLKNLQNAGTKGVIIGKALYEGRFRLDEALSLSEGFVC